MAGCGVVRGHKGSSQGLEWPGILKITDYDMCILPPAFHEHELYLHDRQAADLKLIAGPTPQSKSASIRKTWAWIRVLKLCQSRQQNANLWHQSRNSEDASDKSEGCDQT